MKLQIIYDSETSSSLGHAQRVQSEVNEYITSGSISNSVSSSLEQGSSGEWKVTLNETCCLYDLNHWTRHGLFPEEYIIPRYVRDRIDNNLLDNKCRDGEE